MDIIKLAEEAGLAYKTPNGTYWIDAGYPDIHLENFAQLVAAEERKGCADHYLQIMRDAVEQAVVREREECARLCEDLFMSDGSWCAKSIRSRDMSTKPKNIDTSEECVHETDKSIHQPWVGLTDEEIVACGWCDLRFARAIEAKLKERNT